MSAYVTVPLPMTSLESLLDALEEVGIPRHIVQVHAEAQPLVGYEGRQRAQRAHVIVPRSFLGEASNDLGFLRTELGYLLQVSGYDRQRFGPAWQRKLLKAYERSERRRLEQLAEEARRREDARKRAQQEALADKVVEVYRRHGFKVTRQRTGGRMRLVARKRVYR